MYPGGIRRADRTLPFFRLCVVVCLACLERATAHSIDPEKLAVDDECWASGNQSDDRCALHAMQLRRVSRSASAGTGNTADLEAKGDSFVDGTAGPAGSAGSGAFITNRNSTAFTWSSPTVSATAALTAAFGNGWSMPFGLSLESVAHWLETDLLATSPFGGSGVLVPWPQSDDDQLGFGGWVGYSRRQVCYIAAQTFLGATTPGYNSGLERLMAMCPTGGFRESFASLLAACAADPTLKAGRQGPLLLVAKAGNRPSVESVRSAASTVSMEAAGLRVCDYDTGSPPLSGVDQVPSAGCQPRSAYAPGVDFMTGGLPGQATQDISAGWVGGYLFDAHACGLGGGQDERLTVYFPEVTVLAYFLSTSRPFPQLRQPVWVLGARNFFTGLDGTARFDSPLRLADVPFTSDLVEVQVAGSTYQISSSRPFLAFMSENQGFLGGDDSPMLQEARRNRNSLQRDVGQGRFSFEKQVWAWYRSIALTSYSEAVRPALKKLVKSMGAGPWLAGLWWGDSQAGLLAMWLGHAIAAPTWGQPLPLDYYIYSDFTENPGNQCFVHSAAACSACMFRCASPPPPRRAYYLPRAAYMDGWQVCVTTYYDCGLTGLQDIVPHYRSGTAAALWTEIEEKLRGGSVKRTIFDELLLR